MELNIDKDLLMKIDKKFYVPPEHFKLCTKKFDCFEKNKWITCEKCKYKSYSKKNISVLGYNIFGALKYDAYPYNVSKRIKALEIELKNNDADIIILHEVSKKILTKLMKLDWVRKDYYISECDMERINVLYGIGSVILSKIPFFDYKTYVLPGYDMYSLSFGIFIINDKKVIVGGAQYHSCKEMSTFRKAQFHATMEIFKYFNEKENVSNFIWASDLNFDLNKPDKWSESIYLEQLFNRYNFNNKWIDSWKKKYPKLPGYTEDTEINTMRKYMKGNIKRISNGIKKFDIKNIDAEKKQVRFDAIMYNGPNLNISNIKIIGKKSYSINNYDIWPSDHFGLYANIKIN